MLAALFLFQSAVDPGASLPPVESRCANAGADEIVVCGTRDRRRYRLDPLPDAQNGLGKAETTVGGANVAIVAEQGEVGGFTTNRAMVRLKIKF